MQRLFGIPVDELAVGLAVALGLLGGVIAVLALRHRILLRLALRTLTRRRGRAALIVAGLMLGTTIISSALVTGDIMSRTVRGSVVDTLGQTDEYVAVRGAEGDQPVFFSAARVPAIERALRRTGAVDAVAPAVIAPVALQDIRSRRTEARVSLYAPAAGFDSLPLDALPADAVYLNPDAATKLDARAGDRLRLLAGARDVSVR